jgi:hypothetical protein
VQSKWKVEPLRLSRIEGSFPEHDLSVMRKSGTLSRAESVPPSHPRENAAHLRKPLILIFKFIRSTAKVD